MLRSRRPLSPSIRLLCIGALAAAPLPGTHASTTACAPIAFGSTHETLDEAAAQTLHGLLDEGDRHESGGFLIEKDGNFQASRPVTQRARNAVSYCIVLPRGARLAGIYHTHVASPTLSARDRSNAQRAGVPSYIGIIRDRSLLVYDTRSGGVRRLDGRARTEAQARSAHDREATPAEQMESRSLRERLAERVAALLDAILGRR